MQYIIFVYKTAKTGRRELCEVMPYIRGLRSFSNPQK